MLGAWANRAGFVLFDDPALVKMAEAAIEWQDSFLSGWKPGRWLSLFGSCGIGKTHLAKQLWGICRPEADWRKCAYSPYFVYWPDFVQKLRSGDCFAVRNDMKGWPLLVLDDIGAERDTSGFAAEELHTLLGCRVGRWTILTGNVTLQRLEAMDARIASRVIRDRNIVVQAQTTDYALRQPKDPWKIPPDGKQP